MWAALLLALPFPALADVISARPDSVVLTVYRDRPRTTAELREAEPGDTNGLAMVTETRTVDLPAGVDRIVFQGVADEIVPASARLDGLPGKLVERNFDYDLLTPGALIEKSVGGQVSIRRLDRKTGEVTEEPATLQAGANGVVVVTQDGAEALGCGSGPEALIFDHLPEGLADRPALSVTADVPAAGRYALQLSYLMVSVDWSADYVARVAPDGKTLDLTGWLTLSNRSSATFGGAPTSVVAGHLAREAPDLPNITPTWRNTQCWPMGTTTSGLRRRRRNVGRREEALQKVPVAVSVFTAKQRDIVGINGVQDLANFSAGLAYESELGDYKLYTLAEPTTLAAQQTKQIRFLDKPGVTFETLYVLKADGDSPLRSGAGSVAATTTLSLVNKTADGLGLPLPAGDVSVMQPQPDGREFYIGADRVRDVPTAEPFELATGEATDVQVARRVISETRIGLSRRRRRTSGEVKVSNAKSEPVTFELRYPSGQDGLKVDKESVRHTLKNGSLVWRLVVPDNSASTLDLTVVTG